MSLDRIALHLGDCLDVLAILPDASVDAVVTDPPYGLEFMGKEWDAPWKASSVGRGVRVAAERADEMTPSGRGHGTSAGPYLAARVDSVRVAGVPFQQWCEAWARECLRVLKPGGHMLAFGGTRTWHRLAVAVEDAGFEIRDSIAWLYGSGFPKSLDVSKAIDKASRGVPQGGADPTSPHHGKYRTTTTEGKRWEGDSGQSYGAGGSRFLADGTGNGSDTERAASGAVAIADDARRWQGWGTALKPAFEPVVVARKPLAGTVAGNVLAHGTGALNIDACRVEHGADVDLGHVQRQRAATAGMSGLGESGFRADHEQSTYNPSGRWPANVVLDDTAAAELDEQTGTLKSGLMRAGITPKGERNTYGRDAAGGYVRATDTYGDTGGASRFFPVFRYQAKAPKAERPRLDDGTAHPTVKPLDLMRWLVRLVTPPGGTVLEPFLGSGTTAEACHLEGFACIGIERDPAYLALTRARLAKYADEPATLFDGEASA